MIKIDEESFDNCAASSIDAMMEFLVYNNNISLMFEGETSNDASGVV